MILIFLLTILNCFAGNEQNLSSLPPMSEENVRWMLPADIWQSKEVYGLKKFVFGKFSNKKISFYKDKDLSGESFSSFDNDYYKEGVFTCSKEVINNSNQTKANLKCGLNFCESFLGEANITFAPNYPLVGYFNKEKTKHEQCDVPFIISKFNYLDKNSSGFQVKEYDFFYIPVESYDTKTNTAAFSWKGSTYHFDISDCIKGKNDCHLYDEKYSLWEKQWIELVNHRTNKDLHILNVLIRDLLPCVKKRDKICVEKYFLRDELNPNSKNYIFDGFKRGGGEVPQEITESVFEELEECLSYDRLMPHLLALKGKDLACIPFNGFKEDGGPLYIKFDHVTHPEAVRYNRDRSVIYIKK